MENDTLERPERRHEDIAKDTRLDVYRRMLKNGDITVDVYFKNICNEYEFEPKNKKLADLSDTSDQGCDTEEE